MTDITSIINRFIRGKDGHIHIVEFPNIPIFGWFILMIAANLIANNSTKLAVSHLSLAFLAIWSYLEIAHGLSYFRRTLGIIVAVLTVYSFFK